MSKRLLHILRGPALVLVGCGLLGMVLGKPLLLLLLGALACLGWQLLHLYRLDRWLRSDMRATAWAVDGFWREVYWHFQRQRRRSGKRKSKLRRTLRNFQQGVSAIPDAIVLLNQRRQVVWCNLAARRLLGLDPGQDRGLAIISLVRHPAFVSYLDHWPEQESVVFGAPVDPHVKLRAQLLPYTKKQYLLWLSDVSESQRLEQMRRDFVANASHELRTPLTVITGYLETLQDTLGPEQQAWRQPLSTMQQQAARMMAIIRDLLLLSRLENADEPVTLAPVAVPEMLAYIVDDARALSAERGHDIRLDIEPGLWLNGLERELRSAFANLVFNAVQHTPAGSHIVVRWYQDSHGVHLAVRDDGEGIPPEHLPRLSERFYRVDSSRQRGSGGTGLGLAIVKHVLQRHGATLHISSQLGAGSNFRCDFPPLHKIDRQPAPQASPVVG